MKTYVINLRRRPDRLARMRALLPAALAAEFTTEWAGPVDGKALGSLAGYGLFPWQIASENPWWSRPLKRGEIGCAVSHWLCWQRAYHEGHQQVLILEDDVVFVEGFWPRLQDGLATLARCVPAWELLYLGRYPLEADQPVTAGLVRPGYSHCSFAYLLTRGALQKLLATAFHQSLIPVDEFLPALYLEHPRLDVRERYPSCLAAYAFEPPLVLQLPKAEAGSDTEASAFWEG